MGGYQVAPSCRGNLRLVYLRQWGTSLEFMQMDISPINMIIRKCCSLPTLQSPFSFLSSFSLLCGIPWGIFATLGKKYLEKSLVLSPSLRV